MPLADCSKVPMNFHRLTSGRGNQNSQSEYRSSRMDEMALNHRIEAGASRARTAASRQSLSRRVRACFP